MKTGEQSERLSLDHLEDYPHNSFSPESRGAHFQPTVLRIHCMCVRTKILNLVQMFSVLLHWQSFLFFRHNRYSNI